ncbi:signal peptide peptidase-like 2, partial [Aristolochia californica]|uniref:signal peptide peptidase-like 2 n=1 Tax=Aristolochia californica TaxID=171875 RepID=UPI0035DB6EF9
SEDWVDGAEKETVVGLSARFGTALPSDANEPLRLPAVMANPPNCCAKSTSKLSNSIALAESGECAFTAKAEVAELGGASGLLVINDKEVNYLMLCTENDTSLNITIPVVVIPKSAGDAIKNFLATGKVELQLYSPKRPVVDFSEIFLWMMAVGTILCATLWEDYIAFEIFALLKIMCNHFRY